jgi:hypothetical protein
MPPVTSHNPNLKRKNTDTLLQAAQKLNDPVLASKIRWLQNSWSNDPAVTNQTQTDAIIGLYMALKAIWPLLMQMAEDAP